jgi:hypothetical protein
MQTIKPIIFCALTLGILSTTQTDAFARWEHHGGRGDFAAAEDRAREIPRDDASKLHTVLVHPSVRGENSFDAAASKFHNPGPEVVTPDGFPSRFTAHEGVVGDAHPESKTQLKTETSCYDNPHCS